MRQTEIVASRLAEHGVASQIRKVKTSGDVFVDRPLHELSGQGVFVREIDDRMLSGEVDLAVHSMKDLPTKRPGGLTIAAVLRRDSPHDVLVSEEGTSFEDLEAGSVVGTSSMRRASQIRRARPDIRVENLRGNLQTRLRKLKEGDYRAIVLAEAGIERMGYEMEYQVLDLERFVPSANQGTIVVVAVSGTAGEKAARLIDDPATRLETMVERKIMETVGGGCVVPMAVHAATRADGIEVTAEVLSLDGTRYVRLEEMVRADSSLQEAEELARRLSEMGGRALVDEAVRTLGSS